MYSINAEKPCKYFIFPTEKKRKSCLVKSLGDNFFVHRKIFFPLLSSCCCCYANHPSSIRVHSRLPQLSFAVRREKGSTEQKATASRMIVIMMILLKVFLVSSFLSCCFRDLSLNIFSYVV